MIEYIIGVDGGGSGTRVRLARLDGQELAQGQSGPSGLGLGIERAWTSVAHAVTLAFRAAGLEQPSLQRMAIGLGLAEVLHADGSRHEVGGWGFPSGDEAGGAWIGMRAINHAQQVVDGRVPGSAFATAIIDACGGQRDAMQVWLAAASQTNFAQLARLVLEHAASNAVAHTILVDAGRQIALIARALDPAGALPVALCGGLAAPLSGYLPAELLKLVVPAQGDSAAGGLRLIRKHLQEQ